MSEVEREPADEQFAARFANLLIDARRHQGLSCRAMSKRSAGRFSVADLHAYERGDGSPDEGLIDRISELYGVDLESILPERRNLSIGTGVLSIGDAGGSFVAGDTTSLLTTYLRTVRGLRRQQRAPYVELRRDDVEHLAQHVEQPGEAVVDQLAALMGATRIHRGSMLGLFSGGAMVLGVIAAAVFSG
ncbi:MAG: helix-turn-helix transcriptional regulator [Ilumatobacteraceae bacterium]